MNESIREIPRTALRFPVGECSIGDNGDGAKTAPFRMLARSGDPINHWYFGPMVHDNSGAKFRPRVTIDYAHEDGEILGFANHVGVDNGDLIASGVLQSIVPGDRASEVIARGKAGQPYEASIAFDGDCVVEEWPAGHTGDVNGRTLSGPLLVFRQWNLRGIAVCPYGYDKNTSTELKQGDGTVSIRVLKIDAPVELTQPAVEAAEPIPQAEPAPVEEETVLEAVSVETTATNAQPEEEETASVESEPAAAVPPEDSPPDPAAIPLPVAEPTLTGTLAELRAEVTELRNRLAALGSVGDTQPVSFGAETQPEDAEAQRVRHFSRKTSAGVAAFAASIQLPKRR